MATKLYVGGLAYAINDDKLNDIFSDMGKVTSAQVITDRSSGQSKGFGFVEFDSAKDAERAIKELSGKEVEGRPIMVNAARPKEDRPKSSYSNRNFGSNYKPRY